ncbi:hypothetical protein [Niveibacterium microcysteis]|uniref:DUF3828 domain-containing protein n=1 Tax=Niveibacterium microcysteis TaxID=2811415 RepID=A0ABX7M5Q7_9RHOO|nr:hypothetical protein [Niveibacterium microcysteis]QSI77076.1 hypothetical protein JY500_00035 [Niveibacterium microcysteis]
MSRIVNSLLVGIGLSTLSAQAAQSLTPEQLEVRDFIKKLYSYDPATFEGGEFDVKTRKPYLLNKAPDNPALSKYLPKENCELIEEFFDRSIIRRTQKKTFVACSAPNLFPHLGSEEISPATRYEDIARPLIETPTVIGNTAKVVVYVRGFKSKEPGQALYDRNIFYLSKTDIGWRITNVLTILGKGSFQTRPCGYESATKLTPEQLKDAPSECE